MQWWNSLNIITKQETKDQSMSIFIPPNIRPLSEETDGQIRLGIQGPPFVGKTFSALTFPNPVLLSFDKKANAHSYRTDVLNVPFYDAAFCDSIIKRTKITSPPNRKDALLKWLDVNGPKFSNEQTLIFDNFSGIEEAFHIEYWNSPVYTQGMEVNTYAEWDFKIEFFRDLHVLLKATKANVVTITHEQDEFKKGQTTGKIKALLSGQAGQKLGKNYTDWFASTTVGKPSSAEEFAKLAKWSSADSETIKKWCESTPERYKSIHLWQTQGDDQRDCGTSTMYLAPKYVLATYESFLQYRRKSSEQTTK